MGLPMSRRLCAAGSKVNVWNRTLGKTDSLAKLGATVHHQAAIGVEDADIVDSTLERCPVVKDVLFNQGVAVAIKPGALFIDMASIKPREARDHAARLGALGVSHLDAPVSGGVVGGTAADFERAQPVLAQFGRATHVGPHGSGQLTKLTNQMIVGITIGAVAEALLFTQRGGADMAKVKEAITGGFADSRILQVHGQRMVERDFAPRARMSIQLKDMRNVLATADEIGFSAPVTALFEKLYAESI